MKKKEIEKLEKENREMKKWLNRIYEDTGFFDIDENEFFQFVEKMNGNPMANLVLFQEENL